MSTPRFSTGADQLQGIQPGWPFHPKTDAAGPVRALLPRQALREDLGDRLPARLQLPPVAAQ
ncbi:hypothetical protein QK290_18325, partial [Pseudarthrobacter sp. AL07]|uniref:hypothetical protein n=1 Tax=unclassified Pseudarthrobacter TaxID=2647000 RepID=UPI00249C2BC3